MGDIFMRNTVGNIVIGVWVFFIVIFILCFILELCGYGENEDNTNYQQEKHIEIEYNYCPNCGYKLES